VVELSVDEALERMGTGSFQVFLLVAAGMAFAGDSIEVSFLSFLSPCVQADWGLSNVEAASIASVVFAGEMVGAVALGSLADTIGRRPVFLGASLLIFCGGMASALAWDFWSLAATRTIAGFGIGGLAAPFNLLAELLQPKHRGTFLLSIEFFWTLGSMFAAGAAWLLLDAHGWRWLAVACAVPVLLALPAAYRLFSLFHLTQHGPRLVSTCCHTRPFTSRGLEVFSVITFVMMYIGLDPASLSNPPPPFLLHSCPESPRWLLMRGREAEARAVLVGVAKANGAPHALPKAFRLVARGTAVTTAPAAAAGYAAAATADATATPDGTDKDAGTAKVATTARSSSPVAGSRSFFGGRVEASVSVARVSEQQADAEGGGGSVAAIQPLAAGDGYSGGGSDGGDGSGGRDGDGGGGEWGCAQPAADICATPALRRTTALVWIVWLAFGLAYYGVILFITRLFAVRGGGDDDGDGGSSSVDDSNAAADDGDDGEALCSFDYGPIFTSATSEVVGLAAAVGGIDRAGRKGTQALGYAGAAVASLLLGVRGRGGEAGKRRG